jgi:hypothetical protein
MRLRGWEELLAPHLHQISRDVLIGLADLVRRVPSRYDRVAGLTCQDALLAVVLLAAHFSFTTFPS